jgi:hypothetical protein
MSIFGIGKLIPSARLLPINVRFGHKQTSAPQKAMSALPPKADMCGATKDVRKGPIADIKAQPHAAE